MVQTSTRLTDNLKCLAFCILVSTSYFQYGFDTGIVNGFQAMEGFLLVFGEKNPLTGTLTIETRFQQLITSLLQVGLVISSLALGPLSTRFGRRRIYILAALLSCVGLTIQILVTTQWPVYIGRLLLGLANGLYVNVTVVYISEIAPAQLRGLMVALFQIFVNGGTFIASLLVNAFSQNTTKISYQAQLAILYFVPLMLALTVWSVPESPRWLMVQGREREAEQSLVHLRSNSTPAKEIQSELLDIANAIQMEKQMSSQVVWKDIWRGRDLVRTLLCIACATFHAAAGVNFLVGYGTFFFQAAGISKPFTATIILQSVQLATCLVAPFIVRRFSRRSILLTGFAITSVSLLAIGLVNVLGRPHNPVASGKALIGLLCVFVGAYAATMGPLSWVVAGEMTANRLRSHAFGVAMAVGFFFAWVIVFTTPYFINPTGLNWGANLAWIWLPSNLITLVFIYFFLPETKGRKLEELDELFYSRIPLRKFASYKFKNAATTQSSDAEKDSTRSTDQVSCDVLDIRK